MCTNTKTIRILPCNGGPRLVTLHRQVHRWRRNATLKPKLTSAREQLDKQTVLTEAAVDQLNRRAWDTGRLGKEEESQQGLTSDQRSGDHPPSNVLRTGHRPPQQEEVSRQG